MKKSFLSILLATTALVTNTFAETWDCSPEGSTGTCTATLDANGKMTISGTGPMKDWTYTNNNGNRTTNTPWFSKIGQITSVEIEDGITTVGLGAFQKATNLTSVSIPTSVTSISDRAFESAGLVNLTLPNSVQSIGFSSFAWTNLQTLDIPSSVTSIGQWAFGRTYSLETVNFPASLTDIGALSFYESGVQNVTLPSSLETIRHELFSFTSIESIEIPASVKTIEYNAFNQSDLKSITFAEGLESIGYRAFRLTPLEEIVLPDTVKYIDSEAFSNCLQLQTLTFSPTDDLVIAPNAFWEVEHMITFMCAGEMSKCEAKMTAAGYSKGSYTMQQAAYDIKDENGKKIRHVNADGTYYDYPDEAAGVLQPDGSTKFVDENGRITYKGKRIYTVEEAREVVEAAGTDTVNFKIKYK
ncbi:MAG: leucine-rich repeat protein [Alphaproteobacteria bacterium]|nr:leucine-rich repeat protein [Alphaproteobacteria bacterium]